MWIEQIHHVIEDIRNEKIISEETAFKQLEEDMKQIIDIFAQLLLDIPRFGQAGIDIPDEVILQQLKNMEDALKYKDVVLLHDTLNYEIADTLQLYGEILTEMEG